MQKRGQLGAIEFKYFMVGFFLGIISGIVLVFLGTKKIIPFKIPMVCGPTLLLHKKGQLAMIEFRYAIVGFFIGVVGGLVLVYLGTTGVIPFKIPVC